MPSPDPSFCLRHTTAVSPMPHVGCARLSGEHAYDVMDWLCPKQLFIQDGQMIHTLLLDEGGRPILDLYLCSDDDDFLLLYEGMSPAELEAHLSEHQPAGSRCRVEDLTASHEIISLHGPYAWELLGELISPDVIGLPYLTFFEFEEGICFRAGKTGEFGYDLLLERSRAERFRARLHEAGQRYELGEIGLEVLDLAALENGFFNIRAEGVRSLTPMELQLQWRISRKKPYLGSSALSERRAGGVRERITWIVGRDPLSSGETVELDGEPIGRILTAACSTLTERWIGLALLDVKWAHAGIDAYRCRSAGTPLAVYTQSPPLIANRSLFINVQRHSFETRKQDEFPSLVPEELSWRV